VKFAILQLEYNQKMTYMDTYNVSEVLINETLNSQFDIHELVPSQMENIYTLLKQEYNKLYIHTQPFSTL
jgi:hypothetical protein